jgi:hypothetical protein
MAYEKRDGDISVFQDKKKTNDKAPDWTGTALMDGIEYRVAFWQKSATMLAGKIEIARKKQEEPRGGGGSTGFENPMDEDIPFVSQWSIR